MSQKWTRGLLCGNKCSTRSLNSIKVSLFYFSPEIFKLTRRGVLSIRNIAWCSFKFPSRMLPSAVTAFFYCTNVSTGAECHQRGGRPASAQVFPTQNPAGAGAARRPRRVRGRRRLRGAAALPKRATTRTADQDRGHERSKESSLVPCLTPTCRTCGAHSEKTHFNLVILIHYSYFFYNFVSKTLSCCVCVLLAC